MSKIERSDLVAIVESALKRLGGEGTIVEVAKEIWAKHKDDLEISGDVFFTWQYDMRWACQKLRNDKKAVIGGTKGRTSWRLLQT
ncbi:hypothetical protein [Aestuariivirga sp.]|uniref:hypothetical protein n=1 Tax=Aestuariivirga sp. TaxID=2650926 RepID=UPI00391987CB